MPGGRRIQHGGSEAAPVAALLEQGRELRLPEDGAAVERVDHDRPVGILDAHQEMARKTNAAGADSGAPRDLDVDHRERDGDADAPREDVVEKRVLGFVIVLSVSAKAAREPEVVAEGARLRPAWKGRDVPARERLGELVHLANDEGVVEPWVRVGGDQDRPREKVERVVRLRRVG